MEHDSLMQVNIAVISVMVGYFNSVAHIVTVILRSEKKEKCILVL